MNFDKIKGVLFGTAVGDALGLGTEFLSKKEVKKYYPQGLYSYDQISIRHKNLWARGEWTDDTEQMLCILDSLIENKKIDIKDIAYRFHRWAKTDGRGIGYTTYRVLSAKSFLTNPKAAAKEIWLESKKQLAPNGGVMRTSVLGIWEYSDKEKVIKNATDVCQITHYDPRCAASCVLLSYAISLLMQGKNRISVFKEIKELSKKYGKEVYECLNDLETKDIYELELDDRDSMGYTLKTLAAGFWTLMNAKNFKDGLIKIVNQGGDADTNGAVAGALLGANFGFRDIPKEYVDGLEGKNRLMKKFDALIKIMG